MPSTTPISSTSASGDQFGSGFVAVNPNSKIPALLDRSTTPPDARLRVRSDPALPGREVRGVRAHTKRAERARGVPVVALLADGGRAVPRRRLRPLLRVRAREARVPDQPLRDGGQAPARRARSQPRRPPLPDRRRVHDRRHGDLALVRRTRAPQPLRGGGVPGGEVVQERGALGAGDPGAPGGSPRRAREQGVGARSLRVPERHSARDLG